MNEEEKEAITIYENFLDDISKNGGCIIDVDNQHQEEYQSMWKVFRLIKKQQAEIEDLKASHIITHNKSSNEEKAILFDTINNTIDTYLENTKPYWKQIMVKDKMTIEEAETIIDDMYQDRNKILRKAGETETEVIFDVAKLDEVQFTNLEFASVRALREIQSLRREGEKKDKIIDLMAIAINNYDSQLVINTYKNKEHVKEVFEEYYNYKIEEKNKDE